MILPLLIASLISSGTTPDARALMRTVVPFYSANHGGQILSAVPQSFTALAFFIFAAAFTGALRRAQAGLGTALALCIGGAAVLTAGLAIFTGLTLVLGDTAGKVDPSVTQTLNVGRQP
jgi:hypothetical protein